MVADANVLLSGIVGIERESSPPGALLRAWRAQRIELITAQNIRDEVQRHLTADAYFAARLTSEQVAQNLQALAVDATQATITVEVVGVASHPEDDLVLAVAVSAGAEYLVTGDRKLQSLGHYRGVTILSPRAFLALLEREDRDERSSR